MNAKATASVPSYHVLENNGDGGGMTRHDIKKLTYQLCSIHYKCARACFLAFPSACTPSDLRFTTHSRQVLAERVASHARLLR